MYIYIYVCMYIYTNISLSLFLSKQFNVIVYVLYIYIYMCMIDIDVYEKQGCQIRGFNFMIDLKKYIHIKKLEHNRTSSHLFFKGQQTILLYHFQKSIWGGGRKLKKKFALRAGFSPPPPLEKILWPPLLSFILVFLN